jgi:hypothetical protein
VSRRLTVSSAGGNGPPVLVRTVEAAWPPGDRIPPPALGAALRAALRTLFAHQERSGALLGQFVELRTRPGAPRQPAAQLRPLDPVHTRTVAPFLPRPDVVADAVLRLVRAA